LISSVIHLIPAPVKQVQHDGSFLIDEHTVLYIHQDAAPAAKGAASFLNKTLYPATRLPLKQVVERPASGAVAFLLNTNLPAEGYTLNVTKKGVEIGAADAAGFFYGVQTLLQLFPPFVYRPVYEPDQYAATAVRYCLAYTSRITPGFHTAYDVGREPPVLYGGIRKKIPGLDGRPQIEPFSLAFGRRYRLARGNQKIPELTSKGAWRGPDEVISSIYGHAGKRYGGFYTQEEIKDIVAYAATRHIEIIPEIDLPGHSKAIIATYPHILCDLTDYEGLSIQGVSNNVWCASSEDNYRMLEDIVGEMVELFPSSYFHIGGDEVVTTQWTHCARCSAFMKEQGIQNPTEMQSYFVQRMQQILNKFDKTLVG